MFTPKRARCLSSQRPFCVWVSSAHKTRVCLARLPSPGPARRPRCRRPAEVAFLPGCRGRASASWCQLLPGTHRPPVPGRRGLVCAGSGESRGGSCHRGVTAPGSGTKTEYHPGARGTEEGRGTRERRPQQKGSPSEQCPGPPSAGPWHALSLYFLTMMSNYMPTVCKKQNSPTVLPSRNNQCYRFG